MRTSLTAILFLLCAGSASGKYYEAEHYNVNLRLDPRGGLMVTETADFRFVAGPFTYVFRDISATETDGISDVRASMDGVPCAAGTGPGEVEVSGRSPVKVRWHFPSILSGNHKFTVEYRAAGVLRLRAGAQELIWRALPQQRGYNIRIAEIRLEYPGVVQPVAVTLGNSTTEGYAERGWMTMARTNLPRAIPRGLFSGRTAGVAGRTRA